MAFISERVAVGEHLARYVLTSSWLYKDDRKGCPLRPTAFMPHPRIELSVYRIDGCSDEEISTQGREVAEERERNHRAKQLAEGVPYPQGKRTFRFLGRGELEARDVRWAGLDVVPMEPPVRHANIVGWPALTADRKVDEAAQMAYALKLQSKAKYFSA
jgi:hypothetical protein